MEIGALSSEERARLLNAARDVARRAYAPYSGFGVGAAVLTETGGLYQGCNVENASYGLTICAERAAIAAAVAREGGATARIRAIAVATERGGSGSPCGACRQVILELGPRAHVLFQDGDRMEECRADELLPKGFTLE